MELPSLKKLRINLYNMRPPHADSKFGARQPSGGKIGTLSHPVATKNDSHHLILTSILEDNKAIAKLLLFTRILRLFW